jgi:hypothetical protein
MDRLIGGAAFAAVALSLALTGCGGGGGAAADTPAPAGGTPGTTIQGVSTPSSVSVVTAKNAQ